MSAKFVAASDTKVHPAHPWPVRVMHWVGAYAMFCMIFSGWQIYNASPSLPVTVPNWMTLGGWLAGGIAWHISAMWLLVADGLAYLIYGIVTGHFARSFRRPTLRDVVQDVGLALRFKLPHKAGVYNSVQRLLYILVIVASVLAVVTRCNPRQAPPSAPAGAGAPQR